VVGVHADERDSLGRTLGAAAAATFFLLLGLSVVWFARKVADVQDSAVLAAFVIVPALLYVAIRGNLAELRAPGGWAATFVRVARSRVSAAGETLDVLDDVQIIEKESISGLTHRISTLQVDQPVLMTVTMGRSYSPAEIQGYLRTLSQFPRFRLVALLNGSGAFIGCISPSELAGLMRSESLGHGFLEAVRQGNAREVFRYPGMLRKIVPTSATNTDALFAMTTNNLSAIAVVDENRQLRGVVEREQLVSKLVLSLTDAAPGERQ
jgi:CBS domain-containing protein